MHGVTLRTALAVTLLALAFPASSFGQAATLDGSSGDTSGGATVGCIDVSGGTGDASAVGNVGSCTTAADSGGAAGAGAGSGDTSAAGTVGCIGGSAGSGDTSAAASVGSCPAGGGTPEPDPGTGPAGGGGELGEGASGGESGPLGTLARMASGNLPLTGLPVWLVLLAGLTALSDGAFVYRRRLAAADLTAH